MEANEQIEKALKNAVHQEVNVEQQQAHQRELEAKQEFKDSINPDFVKIPAFDNVEKAIDFIQKSKRQKSLILQGDAGLGKTTSVLGILKKKGVDFEYLNNYTTALAFYEFAYNNRDKVLVVDDVDCLMSDTKGIALLKALTDTKQAFVSYTSKEKTMAVPGYFVFKGKVILLSNNVPQNNTLISILDRAIVREMKLSLAEKKALIKPVIETNFPDMPKTAVQEVYEFLCENINETVLFSFRTVIRVAEMRLLCGENWKQMSLEEINPDKILVLIKELMAKHKDSVSAQIEEFKARSGLGRSSFFNYKQRLVVGLN